MDDEALARMLVAVQGNLNALQARIDDMRCEVEALIRLIPRERYPQFERELAAAKQRAGLSAPPHRGPGPGGGSSH